MHCKRQATPGKQGDDGWKSVLYNGTPLDTYRARYLRLAKSHAEGGTPSVQVLLGLPWVSHARFMRRCSCPVILPVPQRCLGKLE